MRATLPLPNWTVENTHLSTLTDIEAFDGVALGRQLERVRMIVYLQVPDASLQPDLDGQFVREAGRVARSANEDRFPEGYPRKESLQSERDYKRITKKKDKCL